jgi:hypothetical protein
MKKLTRIAVLVVLAGAVYAVLAHSFPALEPVNLSCSSRPWAKTYTRAEFRRVLAGLQNWPSNSEYKQRLGPWDIERRFDPPARIADMGGGLQAWQWDCKDGEIQVTIHYVEDGQNWLVDIVAIADLSRR